MDCRVKPGNDDMRNPSRDALASEFPSPPRFKNRRLLEGGEAPKGACQPLPRSNQQTSPSADASVAAARHADKCTQSAHSSACGARPPSGASTAALARDFDIAGSASGHASWDADKCVIRKSGYRLKSRRALPTLSCPSPVTAPHASAVVPRGLMPEAAPARIASPRGGTALAPHCGSHPECVPR